MAAALAAGVLFSTLATPAFASDGVLEINQACAVNTGCFAGDAAGFPVTITSSAPARSFRLTSDLGPLPAAKTAIDATQVTAAIDLGGFRIFGVSVCEGVPVTGCAPTATGIGVDAGPNSVVTNGAISGMGAAVHLGYSGRLSQMNAFSNGEGFVLGNESIAESNLATSNGTSGIDCGADCIVRENTATGNGELGIRISAGGIASDNTANSNGSYGISAGPGSTIQRNTVRSNAVVGLALSTQSAYRENTISSNGVSVLFGTDAGGNVCNGSLTCP
jgi:parallel beta-helix repeat protein